MGIFVSTISAAVIAVSSVITPSPSAFPSDRSVNSDQFTIVINSYDDIKPLENKQDEVYQPQDQSPTIAPLPIAQTPAPTSLTEEQIAFLGNCESGMRPDTNTDNGFYGAFQFSIGTWNSMGTGYERADLAPLEVQKGAVQRLVARSSIFTQFPGCASQMRSQGLL